MLAAAAVRRSAARLLDASAAAGPAPRRALSLFGSWFGADGDQDAPATNPSAEETEARVNELYRKRIAPLNARLKGPLDPAAQDMLPRPCVFILGNHR